MVEAWATRVLEHVEADTFLLRERSQAARGGNAGLEVVVALGEHAGEILGPGPDRVLAVVPVALRPVERVVVGVLRLVDPLLDADVADTL